MYIFDIMLMVIIMKFLDEFKIVFNNKELLIEALTHTSYSNEHNVENYERLEFLGDSVLQIIMTEYFYLNSNLTEGEMSKKRSSYVCEEALYNYSNDLGLIPYIRVGHGQINNINKTIIADIFESTLGAIYLDQGIEKCKEIIYKIVIPYVKKGTQFFDDYKSILQELTQTTKKSLDYRLISETGPAHDKTFVVEVVIENIVYGKGSGKSKKEAEQNAARDAYYKQAK